MSFLAPGPHKQTDEQAASACAALTDPCAVPDGPAGLGGGAGRGSGHARANGADHGVRCVLADHIWRVDPAVAKCVHTGAKKSAMCNFTTLIAAKWHVELLRGILSSEGEDGQLAARVIRQEASDIKHLTIDHHPAVRLGVVLGDFRQGDSAATAAASTSGSDRTAPAATATDHADNGVRGVLADDIGRVNPYSSDKQANRAASSTCSLKPV